MKINYNCKDNDVKLQFHTENDNIDEIWIKVVGEKYWTVLGFDDLLRGIKKTKDKIKNNIPNE